MSQMVGAALQVILIQTGVAGVGMYNRKWPGAFDIATRYAKQHTCGNINKLKLHFQAVQGPIIGIGASTESYCKYYSP